MNRVKYTTTSTGTGTLTLSVETQFQDITAGENTFLATGNPFIYTIIDANGTDWETGYATLSGTTMTRQAIFESTNANAAVNLSAGTHTILVNRSFYEGHVIVDCFGINTPPSFSTANTSLAFDQRDSGPYGGTVQGSTYCPGAQGSSISGICNNPKDEIPYARGYRAHLVLTCSTTQSGHFFGCGISPYSATAPIASAYGPCISGTVVSCTTPIIENPNPFDDTHTHVRDADFNTYVAYNTSGSSITVDPYLYIEWYL